MKIYNANEVQMPLVIIYIGELPEYIKYSCILNSENNAIILITNQNIDWANEKIKVVNIEDFYHNSEESNSFKNYLITADSATSKFRNGFWLKTTERFFILKAYMEYAEINKAIHIEADNLLFSNSVNLISNGDGAELIFPRLDERNAAASILYVGSIRSLDIFCNFISTQSVYKTDMQLLSDFNIEYPALSKNIFSEWDLSEQGKLKSNGFISDAAVIGQYFYGVDPRNIGRPLFNGYKNRSVKLDYELLKLHIDQSLSNANLEYKNKTYKLINLHIHSKIFKKIIHSSQLINIAENLNLGEKSLLTLNIKNLKYIRNLYKLFN
jgi:hypothetical protein